MSEIVSLSLSSDAEMVSHLCKFLRLDDTATQEVRNANGTDSGFASLAHRADIKHPNFAIWQRRVAQTAHFRMIVRSLGDDARFDAATLTTELGIQTMLEMFTESSATASKPLVQWIDRIAFSYRVRTRLSAVRLLATISSRMEALDSRVRVTTVTMSARNCAVICCEIAAVWGLPRHVIALDNISDEIIAVLPPLRGKRSPCIDRIELTVLAPAPAIALIRNCKFHGVVVRKWRGAWHTGRDWSAARALVRFSERSLTFK